jgi:uncharacterized protein YbjT (DUF2867 family)
MTVLVVGANGQLGARCCQELLARGLPVRGTVRVRERGAALADRGVDVVVADLTSDNGLSAALEGVESLIVTANPITPRRGDRPQAVYAGVRRLLDDAATAGVRRVVLVSVPETSIDSASQLFHSRRELEVQVRDAPFAHVVLRFPPFMECWLALVGSSIPLRGEPYATIGRPSPFLRSFRKATSSLVEGRGLMLVPGSASRRNAFIAVSDVARACVEAAVGESGALGQTLDIGGPEVLTWSEVAQTFERVLQRRVRILATPSQVYAAAAAALGPVAEVPAATMRLNHVLGVSETPWKPGGGGLLDPASMTTVEGFLREKAALPAELPAVL